MTDTTDTGRGEPDPYSQYFQPQPPAAGGPTYPTPPSGYQVPQIPPDQKPPRKRHTWRNVILGTLGVMVIVIVIAAVASGGKTPSSDAGGIPVVQVTDDDGGVCSSKVIDASTGMCPGDTAPPSPAASPAASPPPQYTVSQQQAIDKMAEYLIDGQGFSYQGLINQLSSQYGNGFSVADATFAVNTVSTEHLWDTQAAISAKNYMTTEPGWSACGLVQQLDSPYGGYFTQAQAEYGAQSVGLGSC